MGLASKPKPVGGPKLRGVAAFAKPFLRVAAQLEPSAST